jgi:multidrug efflux pump subunit AcrA (membrane-fusion protein)
MKSKSLYVVAGLIIVLAAAWYFMNPGSKADADMIVPVKKGEFEVLVSASGELEAKNSVRIQGPFFPAGRADLAGKISDLVAEGTTVKKGRLYCLTG